MPSLPEVIEKLRSWAAEFDRIDGQCYTAREFIEWIELEHLPRRNRSASSPASTYPLWADASALRYSLPERLLTVG